MGCCAQRKKNDQIDNVQINKVSDSENKKCTIEEQPQNKISANTDTDQIVQVRIQPKQSEQSEQPKDEYLMLLGTAGVGKSTLFKQLGFSDILNETITNFPVGNQERFYFIDTPSFQLEDDIDIRENIIKQFQDYFEKQKIISSFCIVVNFERTDLMKKKVLSVLKYMRKFNDIISIIIVNMELSLDLNKDQEHLKDSFKFFKYNQILFISKDMNQKQIMAQVNGIKFKETQIDLTDTIFEKLTESEDKRLLQELSNKILTQF